MLDPASSKPLYEQIKDYILGNIESGVYASGTRIPSERTLSGVFGVSRLTVKRAFDNLTQEGILQAQVGKGTYVAVTTQFNQQLEHLTSFTEDMANRRQRATSRILVAQVISASEEDAQALKTPPNEPLIKLVRLRLANDIPMAIERTKLVATWFPHLLEDHDFQTESLYAVLRDVYNVQLDHADQSIEARLATPEESQLLRVERGAPILHMTRLTYTDADQPVEYTLSAYCGSRYKFQAVLRNL